MTSSRRRLGQLGSVAAEAFWAAGFWVAGLLPRLAARSWSSPGGQRVLVVAPHPDDETIGCGGTLLRHRDAGDRVWVCFVTDGRGIRRQGADADLYAQQRRAEAARAAAILGAERWLWFGLRENAWAAADLQARLAELLDDWRPDLVYAPSRVDYHPEHARVAHGLALALAGSGEAPSVRVYPVQVPLTRGLTNLVADVSVVVARLEQALDAYATQQHNTLRAMRSRRYAACFYRLGRWAEEFWEMPAEHYCLLHEAPPDPWDATLFRGLRRLPLTDPLAYLQGRSARRELARRLATSAEARR